MTAAASADADRRAQARPEQPASSRWPRRLFWTAAVVLALALGSLAPYCVSSTELVRLRNALLLADGPMPVFDFKPEATPADFLVDHGPPDPIFVAAVERLGLRALPSDWDRALAISAHLLTAAGQQVGGPNQTDLLSSYRAITERGEGYCADFVRAFMALGNAAGMPVRAWAFSFDGFGGHGHMWVEIFNRQLGRLQLLDIYNNAYFPDETGAAMSALAVRQAIAQHPDDLRMVKIVPSAPPGYKYPEKAREYYRNGVNEWYLWWGNNVFDYDRSWSVRHLQPLSYPLAQLGSVVEGRYPPLRVLELPENREQLSAIRRLRLQLKIVAAVGTLALLGLVAGGVAIIRQRRHADRSSAP